MFRISAVDVWIERTWRLHTATPVTTAVSLVSSIALVWSVACSYRNFISPAFADLWNWVGDYDRWLHGHYGWRDVVAPYAEHRIASTKILLLLDSWLDDMNGRPIQVLVLALLAGSGLLTWRMVRLEDDGVGSAVMPPVFWAALMLAVCQYENLELMFQVQFPLACFAAGLAILFLVQATRHVRLRAAGLACAAGVCGIFAAFSMSIGVLLAPCLFVLLGLRRASWVVWTVFAPLSILGVVLYFAGHAPLGRADIPILDWHLTVERVIYSFTYWAAALVLTGSSCKPERSDWRRSVWFVSRRFAGASSVGGSCLRAMLR